MPQEPVRVCHLISTFRPIVGGAQRATEGVCRELAGLGVDALVLTRHFPGLPRHETVAGVHIRRAGLPLRGKAGALAFGIHALVLLATRLRAYRIVHVQNIDAPLLAGMLAATVLRRRVVATIHGEAKLVDQRKLRLGRVRLWLMRRYVHRFTALTAPMQEELERDGVPPARIRLIPNGIDLSVYRPASVDERLAARRCLRLDPDAFVCLSLGRLVPGKRVDRLLRAWALLPREGATQTLLVVGDGPERPRLEALAAELGLDDVRFEGATTAVLDYLHAADIFASASEREGLSLALLEAMAAGLAVIVTELPGNGVLVRDGMNGLVAPIDDTPALRDRLLRTIASPDWRRELGARAHRSVRDTFSLRRAAELQRQLYGELAPRTPWPGARPATRRRRDPGRNFGT